MSGFFNVSLMNVTSKVSNRYCLVEAVNALQKLLESDSLEEMLSTAVYVEHKLEGITPAMFLMDSFSCTSYKGLIRLCQKTRNDIILMIGELDYNLGDVTSYSLKYQNEEVFKGKVDSQERLYELVATSIVINYEE